MRIVMTGAQGQLGSELQAALGDHELVLLDLPSFDLSRTGDEQQICQARPHVVIHAGAYTDVDGAEREPDRALQINADGTERVARAAQTAGARLIYISTDYVFDGSKTEPYLESDEPRPINAYGRSKRTGEERAMAYCADTLVVRTAWLYGAHGKNFVKTVLQLASERPLLKVVADQYGSPTYAKDLANVLVSLLCLKVKGIVHVTNEGCCSWFEFAQEIVAQWGNKTEVQPISTTEAGCLARRPASSVLSLEYLHGLGIGMPSWRTALGSFLESERAKTIKARQFVQ
jgi:dTDP-4-dehydrorhamnose reductase